MEEYKKLTNVTVDKETIREKVRAAVYGYAIGDALGKGTEFMTFEEAAARYPGGLKTYDRIIRDAHRSQWKKNEWTLDTDNVIRTVDCIVESGGIDFRKQAESIKGWYDTAPTDATPVVRRVIAERDYLVHPHAAARRVWHNINEASNEALGGAMFAALLPTAEAGLLAADFSGLTHADTRCLASAAIIGTMANSLLWQNEPAPREELEKLAEEIDSRITPYLRMAYEDNIHTYALDDEDSLWFTRKSMNAGLWPIVQNKTADEALYDVIAEGGDADTNAALALGLVALRDGWKAIPQDLADTIANREILDNTAEKLADFLIKEADL